MQKIVVDQDWPDYYAVFTMMPYVFKFQQALIICQLSPLSLKLNVETYNSNLERSGENDLYTLFSIRNLCWDSQMAKKRSVLKPRRLRNIHLFSFSCYNSEETVINFEKGMFRKEYLTYKQILNPQFSVIFHVGANSPVYLSKIDCSIF